MPEGGLPWFQVMGLVYSSHKCVLSPGTHTENVPLSLVIPACLLLPVSWEVLAEPLGISSFHKQSQSMAAWQGPS